MKKRLCILLLLLGPVAGLQAQDYVERAKAETDPYRKLEIYQQEAGVRPTDLVFFYLGVQQMEVGRVRQAVATFQQGLSVEGCRYPADLNAQLARAYYQLQDYTQAISFAQLALGSMDNHTTAWNILGLAHLSQKNHQDALQAFNRYVELKPESAYAYYLRHLAHHRLNNLSQALSDIDRALQLAPDDKEYMERKVLTLNAMGRYQEAEGLVGGLVGGESEKDPISMMNLGNSYLTRGDAMRALAYLNKAFALVQDNINRDPNYIDSNRDFIYDVYLSRGNAYMNLENYSNALMDFTYARDLKPDYYLAYNRLGELHTQKGNWEEAVINYEQCFMYNPTYHIGWINYGFAYGNMGDDFNSLEVYSEALQLPNVENRGLLLNNRGFTLMENGYRAESKKDLEAAIVEDPDIPMSHISLGEWYLDGKEAQPAIAKFDEALGMPYLNLREKHTAYYKRGMARELLNDLKGAKDDYLQAIAIDPNELEPYERLGVILYNEEQLCAAYKYFRMAVEIDRRDPYQQKARASRLHIIFIERKLNSPCP